MVALTATTKEEREQVKDPPLPPHPTRAGPGTEEKIRVMQWRYRNGYHIHHPQDVGYEEVNRRRVQAILMYMHRVTAFNRGD